MKFVTGNKNKLEEAKAILQKNIERIDLDVDEIQSLDSNEVIIKKVEEIKKHYSKPFFCEDVSVEFNALNGFPGPLIKFLVTTIKAKGLYKILKDYEDKTATAICSIGYFDGKQTHIFKGELKGEIVKPKGESAFGFDPVFKPIGKKETLAEMTKQEKNEISHRMKALLKLKQYLESNTKTL